MISKEERTAHDQHQWLLLHGTPLTPEVWDSLIPLLPAGSTVLRPDITPATTPGDVSAMLVQRLTTMLDTVPGQFHVVGHSFGGQVAIDLALSAPDRIRSLTILCSRDTPYPPFTAAASALESGVAANIDSALARWFRPNELSAGGPVVAYARRCLTQADPVSWSKALASIATFDRSAQDGRLQMPATMIAAEFDQVSPPVVMQSLAERLPNGHFHTIAGAAHMSPFLDPSALAALLIASAQRSQASSDGAG